MPKIVVIKTELAPNATQRGQLSSHLGAARFAYNCLLANVEEKRIAREPVSLTAFALQKFWVHELRETFASEWWKENASEAYRSGAHALADAYTRFFSKQNGHPQFKKRGGRESYTETKAGLSNSGQHVRLTSVGKVRLNERLKGAVWLLKCGATLQATTVSREATGRFYVSLRFRVEDGLMVAWLRGKFARKSDGFVGVDLGLTEFATVSDGTVVSNPRFFRNLETKLAKAQRVKSRKFEARKASNWAYPKSKSEHRAQQATNRVHARIKHKRREFLIATARELVAQNTTLVIEDLAVANMLKNHSLAKSVADASWSQFRHWLTHFSSLYGTELIVADRFYPSSKTCSGCGSVKAKLNLSERTYECDGCGLVLDRDLNASKNLEAYGLQSVAARCAETINGGESLTQSKGPRLTSPKASHENASSLEQPSAQLS